MKRRGSCRQIGRPEDVIAELTAKVRRMTTVLLDCREALDHYGRWVGQHGRDPEIEHAALVRDIDAALGLGPIAGPPDDREPF